VVCLCLYLKIVVSKSWGPVTRCTEGYIDSSRRQQDAQTCHQHEVSSLIYVNVEQVKPTKPIWMYHKFVALFIPVDTSELNEKIRDMGILIFRLTIEYFLISIYIHIGWIFSMCMPHIANPPTPLHGGLSTLFATHTPLPWIKKCRRFSLPPVRCQLHQRFSRAFFIQIFGAKPNVTRENDVRTKNSYVKRWWNWRKHYSIGIFFRFYIFFQ